MKLKYLSIVALAACALFTVTRAQADPVPFTNTVTISLTAVVQAGTNDLAGISTISSPGKYSVNTKQMLSWLAQDEYAEGNWASNSFPTGAQLIVIVVPDVSADFQVLDKHGNVLVDVSDILSVGSVHHDETPIISGKIVDATGVYDPSITLLKLIKFTFDDSNADIVQSSTVGITFSVSGLETNKITDTKPSVAGVYTQSVSASVSDAAGDGTSDGLPFVITGSLGFAGSESLTVPVP